jgi:hypothetical protein
MTMNQITYHLTYWFHFIVLTVRHHPLISVATGFVGFLFYEAISALKLVRTIRELP